MIHQMHFEIIVVQDEDVTAAALNVPVQDFQVTGTAKRHPTDEHDMYVGIGLAVSRLFRQLADQYETSSMGRIKQKEEPQIVTPPPGDNVTEWMKSYGVPPQEMGQGF